MSDPTLEASIYPSGEQSAMCEERPVESRTLTSSVDTTETDEWADSAFVEDKEKTIRQKTLPGSRKEPQYMEKPQVKAVLADDDWDNMQFQQSAKPQKPLPPPQTPPASDDWSKKLPPSTQVKNPLIIADEWEAETFTCTTAKGVKTASVDYGEVLKPPIRSTVPVKPPPKPVVPVTTDEWDKETFAEGPKTMGKRDLPVTFQERGTLYDRSAMQGRSGFQERQPMAQERFQDRSSFQEQSGGFQNRSMGFPSGNSSRQPLFQERNSYESMGRMQCSAASERRQAPMEDWGYGGPPSQAMPQRPPPMSAYPPRGPAGRPPPSMENWDEAAFQEHPIRQPQRDFAPQQERRAPIRMEQWGSQPGTYQPGTYQRGMTGSARPMYGNPYEMQGNPTPNEHKRDFDMSERFDLPPFARDFPSWQEQGRSEKTPPPPGFQAIGQPVLQTMTFAAGSGAASGGIQMDLVRNQHGDKDFYAEDLPMNAEYLKQESHFRSETTWDSFGLPPELVAAVRANRYEFPSKIQAHGISLLLKGDYDNAVVQAPTGSGKTLTFVLSTLARIDKSINLPQIICIAPTVELLGQLTQEYIKYAQVVGCSVAYLRKGSEHVRSHVLLMTPAQASFIFQVRIQDLQHLRFFVVDEADHLLNKEDQHDFATNMAIVIKQVPQSCKILLFSATYSEGMRRDLDEWLERGFVEISVPKEDLVLDNITMHYIKRTPRETKLEILMKLLKAEVAGVTVIFVNTVKFAQVLTGILERRGIKTAILVGRCMTMGERQLTLEDFKKGFYTVLVSTNLLARGIDNTHVSRVINFDIPSHWTSRLVDAETYLHRIGRAGRFTRAGQAITLVSSDAELKMLEDIMVHYGCEIQSMEVE